jgi:hypothetical protein
MTNTPALALDSAAVSFTRSAFRNGWTTFNVREEHADEAERRLLASDAAQPVAEVASKYGDPEAFGEREIAYRDEDIQKLPYGTKLYARPAAALPAVSIDMVLHCPACGLQHIDAPEPGKLISGGSSAGRVRAGWSNPPHRSHLCHGCGHIWRPADVPTNGVQAVRTVGKADSPIVVPPAAGAIDASEQPINASWNRTAGTSLNPLHPALKRDPMDPEVSALRWLLNITTEFDRKDVRTRQAACLLDDYSVDGKTNREHLESLWSKLAPASCSEHASLQEAPAAAGAALTVADERAEIWVDIEKALIDAMESGGNVELDELDCELLLRLVRERNTPPQASGSAVEPFQKALDIRIAQGWQLGGNACPVLYTDTINGEQVRRDDLWLATTAALAATPAPEAAAPADPMDWPLPCDVTVGHGTMRKGIPLRTLVLRMKSLYEMATGNDADVVANRTPEERRRLADQFIAATTGQVMGWCCENGKAAGVVVCDECAETSRAYSAAMAPEPDDTPLETGEGDAR